MKKALAILLAVILALGCSNALAATGLKWRQYWLEMLAPVQKYNFEQYLSLLDTFHSEHPKLMSDEVYSDLRALGEQCNEKLSVFRREEDPFEGTFKLMPASLSTVGENEQIVPHMDGTRPAYSLITFAPEWWLVATKAIFLSDAGDKVSVTLSPKDRVLDYASNDDYMETYTVGFGYDNWETLLGNENMTSIQVRYYGDQERTYDYTLTEEEVQAFRDVYAIFSLQDQLSDALREWCESIETVDE